MVDALDTDDELRPEIPAPDGMVAVTLLRVFPARQFGAAMQGGPARTLNAIAESEPHLDEDLSTPPAQVQAARPIHKGAFIGGQRPAGPRTDVPPVEEVVQATFDCSDDAVVQLLAELAEKGKTVMPRYISRVSTSYH